MKTILVIDDNPETLCYFHEILTTSGYRVISCDDGRSALNIVHDGQGADLIITDYRMPGLNGLELAAELKRLAPSIPMIMCSVHLRSDVYSKAAELGVAEYLQKPVSVDILRQTVAETLAGTAQRV